MHEGLGESFGENTQQKSLKTVDANPCLLKRVVLNQSLKFELFK